MVAMITETYYLTLAAVAFFIIYIWVKAIQQSLRIDLTDECIREDEEERRKE